MKKTTQIAALLVLIALTACERVAPNYYGVLMQDYGKNGKSDYSKQQGRVNTAAMGTELFQVPAFEQRADFEEQVLHLKSADNTEFTSRPLYSYKAIESRVVDLVFQNSRLGSGDDFMRQLENNVLEPHIYDIIKEESRKSVTDTLMANGGSLKFEQRVEQLVRKAFESKGLELITFSANLDFSQKVKDKIEKRNEINTNVTVLDQQIIAQKQQIELAKLRTQENLEITKGITPELLRQQELDNQRLFIEKWDGKSALYGNTPITILKGNGK